MRKFSCAFLLWVIYYIISLNNSDKHNLFTKFFFYFQEKGSSWGLFVINVLISKKICCLNNSSVAQERKLPLDSVLLTCKFPNTKLDVIPAQTSQRKNLNEFSTFFPSHHFEARKKKWTTFCAKSYTQLRLLLLLL